MRRPGPFTRYRLVLALVGQLLVLAPVTAAPPRVLASILPLHSLAAAVMTRVAEPSLLLRGALSPHDHAMRPSEAQLLQQAEVVFWVGPELESFLQRPIAASTARSVALIEAPGIQRLALRGSIAASGHAHDVQDPDGSPPSLEVVDPHIWLSPSNAIAIAEHMAEVLAEVDPQRADSYRENAATVREHLTRLKDEVNELLDPVRARPFAVFHDAFQYFEVSFGLHSVGAMVLHPELGPGARRLQMLREQFTSGELTCVFTEPQFDPDLVERMVEGTDARVGVLDPLGSTVTPGAGAYGQLLRALAGSLAACLRVSD